VQESSIRKYIVFALFVVTPAGFLFKFYSGPAKWWLNNYGAGLLYEVFWILVIFFFLPKKALTNKIPLWVFTITCALEFLQMWDLWVLEGKGLDEAPCRFFQKQNRP
jgi:hypothetical protein